MRAQLLDGGQLVDVTGGQAGLLECLAVVAAIFRSL